MAKQRKLTGKFHFTKLEIEICDASAGAMVSRSMTLMLPTKRKKSSNIIIFISFPFLLETFDQFYNRLFTDLNTRRKIFLISW